MGWETRGDKRYYYRKARGADGRVRSTYCGGGERGLAAEREDRERERPRSVAPADVDPCAAPAAPLVSEPPSAEVPGTPPTIEDVVALVHAGLAW
jgi:hypothetical protein